MVMWKNVVDDVAPSISEKKGQFSATHLEPQDGSEIRVNQCFRRCFIYKFK